MRGFQSVYLSLLLLGLICSSVSDNDDLCAKFPGLFKTEAEAMNIPEATSNFSMAALAENAEYHACCTSVFSLKAFDTLKDRSGTTVRLVQLENRKQYFPTETCINTKPCRCACSCTIVTRTMSALVYKPGSSSAYMFAFVDVPNFCRCYNNLPSFIQ